MPRKGELRLPPLEPLAVLAAVVELRKKYGRGPSTREVVRLMSAEDPDVTMGRAKLALGRLRAQGTLLLATKQGQRGWFFAGEVGRGVRSVAAQQSREKARVRLGELGGGVFREGALLTLGEGAMREISFRHRPDGLWIGWIAEVDGRRRHQERLIDHGQMERLEEFLVECIVFDKSQRTDPVEDLEQRMFNGGGG